ncbi:hypothetical protein [Salinigranum marinum]|uniref:hypothetical protein n=1 Tax=Salinigranum marinum TaxID=1515595 RepID=UPI002989C958|nr:hypothetical protein [Salinigranum marinum]
MFDSRRAVPALAGVDRPEQSVVGRATTDDVGIRGRGGDALERPLGHRASTANHRVPGVDIDDRDGVGERGVQAVHA